MKILRKYYAGNGSINDLSVPFIFYPVDLSVREEVFDNANKIIEERYGNLKIKNYMNNRESYLIEGCLVEIFRRNKKKESRIIIMGEDRKIKKLEEIFGFIDNCMNRQT